VDVRRGVLHGVVEQRTDGLVFRAAVVEHQRRHGQHVRDVGHRPAFARLIAVDLVREQQRRVESSRQRHEPITLRRAAGHPRRRAYFRVA
jgi:hypothetical protein